MKKPHLIPLFLFLLWVPALAQKGRSVAATVDKTSILIGQPLKLTLEATFSNAHTPAFFQFDSLPHFEVLNRSKIDTQAAAAQTVLTQTITLTSWDSGAWAIPAFSLPAEKRTVTAPLPITVAYTPAPPTQDYHDIHDILEVPKPPRTTWYWYVIGAALLLLFLLLLFPKRKKATETPAPKKENAYNKALLELQALQQKTTLDDKEYFTELIQVFRTYLQHGKGVHSFQKTTEDLSRQLQALPLPHEDLKKLVQTLQVSDFVKFAQLQVTPDERTAAWAQIKTSITAIEPLKT